MSNLGIFSRHFTSKTTFLFSYFACLKRKSSQRGILFLFALAFGIAPSIFYNSHARHSAVNEYLAIDRDDNYTYITRGALKRVSRVCTLQVVDQVTDGEVNQVYSRLHSWSYHRLQVGLIRWCTVCRCMRVS